MKFIVSLLLWFIATAAVAAPVLRATVDTLDIASATDKTQLSLNITGNPSYKIFSLSHPERLVIDFQNTQMLAHLKNDFAKNTLIATMRAGKGVGDASQHNLRLVLELKNKIQYKYFSVAAKHPGAKRLIIEIIPTTGEALPVNSAVENVKKSDGEVTANTRMNNTKSPTQVLPSAVTRDVVVVVDPGHGGKDPGAIGASGTREKDVVLGIARKLQALLDGQPGMRAILTRKTDLYIGLRQRTHLARKDRADMFVAIHADAFRNAYSSGASIYALSASGASSEAARWLAEKENTSELGGVNLEDKGSVLRSVLLDLSQTATISLSLQLAASMLQELGKFTRLHHNRVEQARFMVLKSPDIPSVLVETGFISNTTEERHLRDPLYQQQIAYALIQGIRSYFIQNPPPGTIFSMQRDISTKHVVKPGETLAMVAQRYSLSPQLLRDINRLQGNEIKPGQILEIPGTSG